MMSEKDNGGPAFPTECTIPVVIAENQTLSYVQGLHQGMTLRDWFAGQALAGYFAAPNTPHQNATDCAAYIYEMADAMLAARKGGAA